MRSQPSPLDLSKHEKSEKRINTKDHRPNGWFISLPNKKMPELSNQVSPENMYISCEKSHSNAWALVLNINQTIRNYTTKEP